MGLFCLFAGVRSLVDDFSKGAIFTGLGIFFLGILVYSLRTLLGRYRTLRRLAHSGKPIPGEIINVATR